MSALVQVVRVSKKGQVAIPKRLREKYCIADVVSLEEAEGGILLRSVPSPSGDLGSFKGLAKGKNARDRLHEAREVERRKDLKRLGIDEVDDLHRVRRKHSMATSDEIDDVANEIAETLYGSVRVGEPIDDPKRVAREYIRKKLLDDLQ